MFCLEFHFQNEDSKRTAEGLRNVPKHKKTEMHLQRKYLYQVRFAQAVTGCEINVSGSKVYIDQVVCDR